MVHVKFLIKIWYYSIDIDHVLNLKAHTLKMASGANWVKLIPFACIVRTRPVHILHSQTWVEGGDLKWSQFIIYNRLTLMYCFIFPNHNINLKTWKMPLSERLLSNECGFSAPWPQPLSPARRVGLLLLLFYFKYNTHRGTKILWNIKAEFITSDYSPHTTMGLGKPTTYRFTWLVNLFV